MKNTNERLFWFYIIDGRNGKAEEAEQMLRPFMQVGHRLDNLYIFTSGATIIEINAFIKEHKLKDFMYMLTDMTDNITSDTFKMIVNEDYYRPAEKFLKLLSQFKPEIVAEETTQEIDPKVIEAKVNKILEKISANGADSLTPQQKTFLEDFTKGKYDIKK
jgi:hypothetical protein